MRKCERMRWLTFGIAVIVILGGVAALGGDMLFKDGTSDWTIIISEHAATSEAYAAEELQTNVWKIGKVTLPIVKSNAVPGGKAVVIGSLTTPAVKARATELGLEEGEDDIIAMKTLGGNLYLAANSPRATLYSVYHFLYDQLDARWYWPGENGGRDDGTYLTPRASYELPKIEWRYRPRFRYREMSQCGYHGHVPTERWLVRQGLNAGCQSGVRGGMRDYFIRAAGTHSIGVNASEFEKHPDWFSLIDGKRVKEGEAGCWSNPGFTEAMVERLLKLSADADLLNAFIYDTTLRCQCPDCTNEPDVSSRFYNYYRKLTEKARTANPKLKVAALAYQEYRAVPKHAPCDWLEYVEYCQYNRCYVHKLDDPDCGINRKSMEEIGRWAGKTPVAIYGYQFDIFNKAMFVPFWNMLADEVKTYARCGRVVRMKTEMPIARPPKRPYEQWSHVKFRIPYYIYAKMVWDPSLDPNDILRDWCDHVYGPGAKPMFDYLTQFAAAWDAMKGHATYFGGSPDNYAPQLLSAELMAHARKCFSAAEAAVKARGDDSDARRTLNEISFEKSLFDEWVKVWEVTCKDHVSYNLPHFAQGAVWEDVKRVPLRDEAGSVVSNADARIYWSDTALDVRVCGVSRAGVRLETGDGEVRAFPLTGETLSIPFAGITGGRPSEGDTWRLALGATAADGRPVGYPVAKAGAFAQMASVIFSERCSGQRLVWICSPHAKDGRYNSMKSDFVRHGWNTECLRTQEEAEAADYSNVDLILFDSYQNKLSKECFRQKIVPAVRNGAVLFMNCYYWCEDLDQKFEDPTYKIGFRDDVKATRRPSWYTDTSFATTPNDMKKAAWHTPAGVLFPRRPECWEVLARQVQKSTDEEQPYMVIRPCGKGAVLVTAGLFGDLLPAVDNALEYGRKIAAEAENK